MTTPTRPPLHRPRWRLPPPPLHHPRCPPRAMNGAIAIATIFILLAGAMPTSSARPMTDRARWARIRFCVAQVEDLMDQCGYVQPLCLLSFVFVFVFCLCLYLCVFCCYSLSLSLFKNLSHLSQ